MLKNKQILEEVEKTLQSYDEDIMLEVNPFLLTRINARKDQRSKKQKKILGLKINMNQIIMILILLLNLITCFYNYDLTSKHNLQKKLVDELKTELQIDQSENNY
jgi:hypothetical protein